MSRRKKRGSALGRSAEVVRKPAPAPAPVEPVEPEAPKRSSVGIDPLIRDRTADAAHYLGRSLESLAEELVGKGLDRLVDVQPPKQRPTAQATTGGAKLGGRVQVDLSKVGQGRGGARRRSSLSMPGVLRERLANEAYRLRQSQKGLLGELLREGLRGLRQVEADRIGDPRFDWPPRPTESRGRRWR